MKFHKFTLFSVCLLTSARGLFADTPIINIDERSMGVEINVTSPYDTVPPAGHLPVIAVIKNRTVNDLTWNLNFSGDYSSTGIATPIRLTVPAGKEKAFALSIPITPQDEANMPRMHLTMNGPAAPDIQGYMSGGWFGDTSVTTVTDYFLISEELARATMPEMDTQFKAGRMKGYGSRFDAANLSRDWRDLAGAVSIFITPEEYGRLDGLQRTALETWLNQGGRLHFAGETATESEIPQLVPEAKFIDSVWRLGAGVITVNAAPKGLLPPAQVKSFVHGRSDGLSDALEANYHSNGFLNEGIAAPGLHEGMLMTIAFAFAIAVAPLNLIILAKRRQRHLLFLTVPALSLLASVALGAAIFIGDGVGGKGNRASLVIFHTGQTQKTVIAEELSVTGLLIGSDFEVSPTAMTMPASRSSGNNSGSLVLKALPSGERSGQWYASRSQRAMLAQDVRSTREKVSLIRDGEKIQALSQCESGFDTLLIRSGDQKWYLATNVTTGVPSDLQEISASEASENWGTIVASGGPRTRQILDPSRGQENVFIATGSAAASDRIPTLKGIHFVEKTIFTGPVAP